MRVALVLIAAALPLAAQSFDEPGPHHAGWQSVSFVSPPTIQGRVYYPATADGENAPALAGDGYSLVVLIHGQSLEPADYDLLCLHLAGWGFVVCSVGPLAGPLHAPPASAKHAKNMLGWMVAESDDPQSPFAGLVADGPFGAMGHSLGGTALEHLIGIEPQVGAVIPLAPYYDVTELKTSNLAEFEGAMLSITGAIDTICPPATHGYPMAQATAALGRCTFVEIADSGHWGSVDVPPAGLPDPLPTDEQNRIYRKLATAFLRAELSADEDALVSVCGQGVASEPIAVESMSQDPALWGWRDMTLHDQRVLGIAARAGEQAWIAWSPHPASIATRAGVVGLEPASMQLLFAGSLQVEGIAELGFTAPASLTGFTLHVQGLVIHPTGPVLTRTATWIAR